jgi:adenylylsulfate kinase-like enzyme
MKREFNDLTRNKLEIHVVGTAASGKSAIQLIIAEALKEKGFNVKVNSIDHESEEEFFSNYKTNQEARESGVRELNELITINEVQSVKRPIPYGEENA